MSKRNDKRSRGMTAAELLKDLEGDESYQRQMRQRRAAREPLERALAEDEAGLRSRLQEVGIVIGSVWDWIGSSPSPEGRNVPILRSEAASVLMSELHVDHYPRTLEGIVRALTGEDVASWEVLADLYDGYPERARQGQSSAEEFLRGHVGSTMDADEVPRLAREHWRGYGEALATAVAVGMPEAAVDRVCSMILRRDLGDSRCGLLHLVSRDCPPSEVARSELRRCAERALSEGGNVARAASTLLGQL